MTAHEWLFAGDTGLSSECIWRHMMGVPEPKRHADAYPLDPSDFGRCYRLLNQFPEWRARLPEMASHGPVWAALVTSWDSIQSAYESAVNSRALIAEECYDLMQSAIVIGGQE